MKMKEFFIKNKETIQLVYGLILIIIIPLLIVFNTVFIVNRYNKSIDAILQRQALNFGRSIYALIKDNLGDEEAIQKNIVELKKRNSEIKDLTVLEPDGDNFNIIAAAEEDDIGEKVSFYFYKVAWTQPDNDGLATNSLLLASSVEEEASYDFSDEERFWLVAMPMSDTEGAKKALLAIQISSKIVDDLTGYNRNMSIYVLILTVLIIILFLAATVRLWDYALLYKKIKEVDQMKDEFISIASHELRTPVTGIKGYASMILDGSMGKINEKIKENLKIIQGAADRLAYLVEDLLNVSRIEQKRLKVGLKTLEAGQIIEETVRELKVQSDEKGLVLEYKPHKKELPLTNLDQDRFRQVLINLIGNAIKYTKKGKVEIRTSEKNNGKILEIIIKDTGVGMTAKERERLFQKFYRVQSEETRGIVGTGLGLWITKQIIELMKGSIMIDSMKDVGTQVTLSFPTAGNAKS